jgi:hypothetical protein
MEESKRIGFLPQKKKSIIATEKYMTTRLKQYTAG